MADLQQQYLVVIADIKHADGSVIRGVGRVVQDGLIKKEAKTQAQEHSGQILKQDKAQCLCVTAETTTDGLLLGEEHDTLSKKTIKQSGITYDAASTQAAELSQPNAILVALPLSGTTKAIIACLIALVLVALMAGGVTLVSLAEEEVEPTTVAVEEVEEEKTIVESEDDDTDTEEDLATDDSTDEEAVEDAADEASEEATDFSSASSDSSSSGSSSSFSGSSTSGNSGSSSSSGSTSSGSSSSNSSSSSSSGSSTSGNSGSSGSSSGSSSSGSSGSDSSSSSSSGSSGSSSDSGSSSSHTHSWTATASYSVCLKCYEEFYDKTERASHLKNHAMNDGGSNGYTTLQDWSCSCGATRHGN